MQKQSTRVKYSSTELEKIQNSIKGIPTTRGRFRTFTTKISTLIEQMEQDPNLKQQFQDVCLLLESKQATKAISPFMTLAIDDVPLLEKLSQDPLVASFSYFGFFPETFERITEDSTISFAQGHRGLTFILKTETGGIVVKPVQSFDEPHCAKIAQEIGLGSIQLPTLEGFITEEYIDGSIYLNFVKTSTQGEQLKTGRRFGEKLSQLHKRNIIYNDTSLADDFGNSHVIITPNGEPMLIDFGVALDLTTSPNYFDDQILARLKSMHGAMIDQMFPPEVLQRLMAETKSRMDPEKLKFVDLSFIESGVFFRGTPEFYKGSMEGYNQ